MIAGNQWAYVSQPPLVYTGTSAANAPDRLGRVVEGVWYAFDAKTGQPFHERHSDRRIEHPRCGRASQ